MSAYTGIAGVQNYNCVEGEAPSAESLILDAQPRGKISTFSIFIRYFEHFSLLS